MSILQPLTNKIYGISSKSAKLNNLYKQYCHQRGLIEVQGQAFNKHLDNLKSMIVYNTALLVISSQVHMDDSNYGKWLEDTKPFTMGKPETSEVAEVFAFVADATAGILVGKVVKNVASAIKNSLFNTAAEDASSDLSGVADEIGDALAEAAESALDSGLSVAGEDAAADLAEDATEAAIESATSGSLGAAAIGGAIVLALGVDAIVSAIESASEAKQIEEQTNKLQKALDDVNTFLDALNKKMAKVTEMTLSEQKRFIKAMNALSKIQAPKTYFNYPVDTKSTPKFLASMHDAASQYFYLQSIRTNWERMRKNMPNLTWELFTTIMDAERPEKLTAQEVEGFLAYAAQYSQSMQKASNNKSQPALAAN